MIEHMDRYNYLEKITNDIECWMDKDGDPFDISQFKDKEEAKEFLYDELWVEDAITGNGSYGYADEFLCEEYLCHNLDLLFEALFEFGEMEESLLDNIHKHIKEKNFARWADCTIRCYLLSEAIDKALKIWENYGYEYSKMGE